MAIVLMVRPGKGEEATLDVPVAPLQTFREFWLPACKALGLKWVPLFETGIPVGLEDVPDVLAELHALKGWLQRPGNEEAASFIGERVDMLVEGLEAAVKDPGAYITIG